MHRWRVHENNSNVPINGNEPRDQTTRQLSHQGLVIPLENIESLERQLGIIANTKDAANETVTELARQEGQLLCIANDANGFGYNLKRGVRQIRLIGCILVGDVEIRCVCYLILLAIFFAIFIPTLILSDKICADKYRAGK